jgi:hypothetical protein
MRKETLEEAAERLNYFVLNGRTPFNNGFKEGAKWQQERSYSEEEVRQLFQKYISTQIPLSRLRVILHKDFKDWFEQFKKK